ncbi:MULTISPECIES: hypothetical protein [Mycetohabitans]|uniref:hypothetical protein n=1 Tax=Mycetohabitans TaxID=2571159 RepID=UPI0005A19C8B|nr:MULTISPECIES: hypothetical protein [Mycetohabitans]MCG1047155.1 hypothetical protein [Mycetohabitans sp. B6]
MKPSPAGAIAPAIGSSHARQSTYLAQALQTLFYVKPRQRGVGFDHQAFARMYPGTCRSTRRAVRNEAFMFQCNDEPIADHFPFDNTHHGQTLTTGS